MHMSNVSEIVLLLLVQIASYIAYRNIIGNKGLIFGTQDYFSNATPTSATFNRVRSQIEI